MQDENISGSGERFDQTRRYEQPYRLVSIERIADGRKQEKDDPVVCESPVTIYVNGEELVTLLASPEYLEDLALGFLVAEGFIRDLSDVTELRWERVTGQVFVEGKTSLIAPKTFMKRYVTTGCGKGTTYYDVTDTQLVRPLHDRPLQVSAEQILQAMGEMQGRSDLYRETGGVHGAALASAQGITIFREDVGRHNAVDKIIGHCFRAAIPLDECFLLTSGRISSEILLKVAKMGIPLLASRSAPTDLALKLAEEIGVTVIGFVRGRRMNIYTHPGRIICDL